MDATAALTVGELSIMVVEPSTVQANIITTHLRELNVADIDKVGSGADALSDMQRHVPDLVVSAMYLPDMTAIELVQTMRNTQALESVPFMLISSETAFAMLDPLRQAGIIAILPKPFAAKDLQRALYATIEYINPDEDALSDVVLDDLTVLVVDDSSTARKHISRVLNNLGIHNLTLAQNGREAVDLIEQNFFDLVVTDYNMPEMDGDALTRYIREHSTQRSIPILMVTSEPDQSRLSAVQQAGVSGICDKPFDAATVKTLIRSMLADA